MNLSADLGNQLKHFKCCAWLKLKLMQGVLFSGTLGLRVNVGFWPWAQSLYLRRKASMSTAVGSCQSRAVVVVVLSVSIWMIVASFFFKGKREIVSGLICAFLFVQLLLLELVLRMRLPPTRKLSHLCLRRQSHLRGPRKLPMPGRLRFALLSPQLSPRYNFCNLNSYGCNVPAAYFSAYA